MAVYLLPSLGLELKSIVFNSKPLDSDTHKWC